MRPRTSESLVFCHKDHRTDSSALRRRRVINLLVNLRDATELVRVQILLAPTASLRSEPLSEM